MKTLNSRKCAFIQEINNHNFLTWVEAFRIVWKFYSYLKHGINWRYYVALQWLTSFDDEERRKNNYSAGLKPGYIFISYKHQPHKFRVKSRERTVRTHCPVVFNHMTTLWNKTVLKNAVTGKKREEAIKRDRKTDGKSRHIPRIFVRVNQKFREFAYNRLCIIAN